MGPPPAALEFLLTPLLFPFRGHDSLILSSLLSLPPPTLAVAFAGTAASPALSISIPTPAPASLSLVIVAEDVDSPLPRTPIVHGSYYNLPAEAHWRLEERKGTEGRPWGGRADGGWIPPRPLRGHGAHRYAFQVFLVEDEGTGAGRWEEGLSKDEILQRVRGKVKHWGVVKAAWERGYFDGRLKRREDIEEAENRV